MAVQREIQAKSILIKSGISDFSINCYGGCLHNCVYCYARYMRKFSGHSEPWGQYLDVKINAPEVLAREVTKKKPGSIFVSSACDGWQPAERKYQLTRQCCRIAADAGFRISALTKSSLITRDFDIFKSALDSALGCTITTLDETIRRQVEVAASSSQERIHTLERAREAGIKTWAFVGPLLPGLTAEPGSIQRLFHKLAALDLSSIVVDKINFRSGVYESITQMLQRFHPELLQTYRLLYREPQEYEAYTSNTRLAIEQIARAEGLESKIVMAMR